MSKVHPVPSAFAAAEQIKPDTYARLYKASIDDPEQFWADAAKRLEWIEPPTQIRDVSFDAKDLYIRWYADGVLNPTASCLDRHLEKRATKPHCCSKATTRTFPAQSRTANCMPMSAGSPMPCATSG